MLPVVPEMIQFLNGNRARAVYAPQGTAIEPILAALELPRPRGILVVFGGTAQLSAELATRLHLLLHYSCTCVEANEDMHEEWLRE